MKKTIKGKMYNKEILKHPEDSIFQEGYGQIPKYVMCDRDLHAYSKFIYAYLCSYAGAGNQAFPGVSRICGDLHISTKTFYKYFKVLEDAGYMTRVQAVTNDNKFYNNVYEFVYRPKKKKRKDNILPFNS